MGTYVFFDIGQVLLNNGNGDSVWQAIAARTDRGDGWPRTHGEVREKYNRENTLLCPYGKGQATTRAFLEEMRDITGFGGTLEELGKAFAKNQGLLDENVRIFEHLKKRSDVVVGIISDTVEIHIAALAFSHGFLFERLRQEAVVFSYHPDMRCRKGDGPEIFRKTLRRLGANPDKDRVFMIDDREQNRAGAQAAGMTFIHLPPETSLAAKLRAHGLEETAAPHRPTMRPALS